MAFRKRTILSIVWMVIVIAVGMAVLFAATSHAAGVSAATDGGNETLKALAHVVLTPFFVVATILRDAPVAAKAGTLLLIGLAGISVFFLFLRLARKLS